MPKKPKTIHKIKTHQRTAKRFRITKTGKVIKRKAGQDHFNSRESRKITRMKRRDIEVIDQESKNIHKRMPYGK